MDSSNLENNNFEMPQFMNEHEATELKALIHRYLKSYSENHGKIDVKEWLFNELKKDLPEKTDEEIKVIVSETDESIHRNENNLNALREAKSRGISSDDWTAKKIIEATKSIGVQKAGEYLERIENTLLDGNTLAYNSVLTKNGLPNMNPNIDGFIAEQVHAHSFNLNAQVNNSGFKAEVLTPASGELYSKNSFDIVIKDQLGNRVHQYQAKFGATASDTIDLIKRGNYDNQRILVPTEQVAEVQKAFPDKTVVDRIGGTDKVDVTSRPLSKEEVKILQEKVQRGDVSALVKDWDEIAVLDLAKGIGKQAAFAALSSAALAAGYNVAAKLCKGEAIEADEVIIVALKTGADTGIKFAVAGSIKVASEMGIVKAIPKGTPIGMVVNVIHIGIENAKILIQMADGELSLREGLEKMEEVTVGVLAGIVCAGEGLMVGAVVGATIGSIFGPIGMAAGFFIGEFVGGVVGYYLGEKIGSSITRVVQKVRNFAFHAGKAIVESGAKVVRRISEGISNVVSNIGEGISNIWSSVFG